MLLAEREDLLEARERIADVALVVAIHAADRQQRVRERPAQALVHGALQVEALQRDADFCGGAGGAGKVTTGPIGDPSGAT